MKLEGIKVVDLSVFLPGPYLTMALADHGAEVIKVEPPGEGDPGRHIGLSDGPSTVFFRNVNRGKKSVVIDLKTAEGRESLLKLCDQADVFVESYRPGVMQRLGIDYATVATRNPRIVYCSISAFGQDGPYRERPAHDLATMALSGALSITLGQDGAPAMPGVAVADMLSALQALSGVLMALLRRQKTGLGDYIDVAMHHAALAALPNVMGAAMSGQPQPNPKHERTHRRLGLLPDLRNERRPPSRARCAGDEIRAQPARPPRQVGSCGVVRAGTGRASGAGDRVPARRFPRQAPGSIGALGSPAWTSVSRPVNTLREALDDDQRPRARAWF